MTPLHDVRVRTWRGLYTALLEADPHAAEQYVDVREFGAILPGTQSLNWEQFLAETRRRREESGASTVSVNVLTSNDHGIVLMVHSRTTITVGDARSSIESTDMVTFNEEGYITHLLVMTTKKE